MDDDDTPRRDAHYETATGDETKPAPRVEKKGGREELTEALLSFLGRLSPYRVHPHPHNRP